MTTIYNLPETIKDYTVARNCDGDFWFWGTWDSYGDAAAVAAEIGGEVFHRDNINA